MGDVILDLQDTFDPGIHTFPHPILSVRQLKSIYGRYGGCTVETHPGKQTS